MVEPEGGPRAVFRRPLTTLKTSDGIIRVLIHFTTQRQKVNNEKLRTVKIIDFCTTNEFYLRYKENK